MATRLTINLSQPITIADIEAACQEARRIGMDGGASFAINLFGGATISQPIKPQLPNEITFEPDIPSAGPKRGVLWDTASRTYCNCNAQGDAWHDATMHDETCPVYKRHHPLKGES